MIYDKSNDGSSWKYDNDFLNLNCIGFKFERNRNSSKKINYNRLNSLDRYIRLEHFTEIKMEIIHEVSRLLSSLDLPKSLNSELINYSVKAYNSFPKHKQLKSSLFIVPAILYLICQKKFIFLNLKKLLELISFPKERLFTVVRNYLRININLFRLLHSENHRKKKIINFCFGYIFENSLNFSLNEIIKYLNQNWNELKNMKDILISAIIIKLISIDKKIFIAKTKLGNYFGFHFCCLYQNSKRNSNRHSILKRILLKKVF